MPPAWLARRARTSAQGPEPRLRPWADVRSRGLRAGVQVLRVGAEVRPEHVARQEVVTEAVHRSLHTGAGALVERQEPRPAAGTTGHVAAHAVVLGQQEVGERAAAAVDQLRAV